jgi:CHAT domain-containing protein
VLGREIESTVASLQTARAEIRRRSPAYAALTRTEAPSPTALQGLLDEETVLLEFRLGDQAGTVWAVTRESIHAFPLPPRAEVERLASRAAGWQRSLRWPGANPQPVCELSEALLSPVAGELGRRRLAIVADGALATVSFAALPDPTAAGRCAAAPPLVAGHEIAVLPSAATLADQRRLLAGRPPADGWLAVLADPVYGPDDERLARTERAPGREPGAAAAAGGPATPRRLPRTAEEARAILDLVPAGRRLSATGFEASRRTVESGVLGGFRIVHFAVHGELDPDRPLLSRLVLSRFDESGQRIEGALPAHEIYDLELPAELVVLSACDTGGGRQVPGEGLVAGLPRAFLYAGAARVLVSLWAVPDDDTRELMTRLYRGLIERRLPPAEALGQAQLELWRAGRPPHAWAGFVLLGDWRPLPPFSG